MFKKTIGFFLAFSFLGICANSTLAVPTLQLGVYTSDGGYGTGIYADYLNWSNPAEKETARFFGNTLLAAGTYGPKDLLIGGQYNNGKDWENFGFPSKFNGHGAILMISLHLETGYLTNVSQGLEISVNNNYFKKAFYSSEDLSWWPSNSDNECNEKGNKLSDMPNHAPVKNANAFLFFDLGDFTKTQTGMPDFYDESLASDAEGQIKEIILSGLISDNYTIGWAHFDLMAIVTKQNGNSGYQSKLWCAPHSHDVTWAVPEPATIMLVGAGFVVLGTLWCRRRKSF